MFYKIMRVTRRKLEDLFLSVPVRWKIIGIGLLPIVILGLSLNYWITTSLSDWLSYILTDVRVEAAMNAGSRSMIFVTILAAVASVFLSLFFTYLLTSPLLALKKTAEEVASGKFKTRADVWANDEIGALAKSINQMIDNFVNIQESLFKTNKQLSVINHIALAAELSDEIHDILYSVLKEILKSVDLEYGWIYLYDPELGKHHLATWVNIPPSLKGVLSHQKDDELCSCQQLLVAGNLGEQVIHHQCSRTNHLDFPNSHLTIPIVEDDTRFGLINLSCTDSYKLDEETCELLNTIGIQVSKMVANAWLQLKLREKEVARQMLLESLVTAQENERQRLARELHDQAGQTLTSLLIRLKTIEQKTKEPHIKADLTNSLDIVSGAIDQIRDLSYDLRPPALEEFGLSTAVEALVADMTEHTGHYTVCNCQVSCDLPTEIEVVLYRILQEGLTNAVRHAGADNIFVTLSNTAQALCMKIEDDGDGFDPAQTSVETGTRHLGLISMNERAELIGGKLKVYSTLGVGTTIEVSVPIV